MTPEEREAQIAAVDAEIAELERIVKAPLALMRAKERRHGLERAQARSSELEEARAADPEYDRKLSEARYALEAAERSVAVFEAARQRKPLSNGKELEESVAAANATHVTGTITPTRPATKGDRGGLRLATFVPAPTLQHRIALDQLNTAKNRVRRLENWPHQRVIAAAQGPQVSTEERIATTPKIPFFGRIRTRGSQGQALIDAAMAEDEARAKAG